MARPLTRVITTLRTRFFEQVALCLLLTLGVQNFSSLARMPPSSPAFSQQHHAGGIPTRVRYRERDNAPMVLIPAGEFVMGSGAGEPDEQPPHRVYLDAFYIDRYEVTVSRYAKFLSQENPELPFLWHDATKGSNLEKPVIGIDWFDAWEYCQWAGKRLPTEAEWEKAARGTDGRIYPWGNDSPDGARSNFGKRQGKAYERLTEVGSYAHGRSLYGVDDLAGNVWEWVADRYHESYYRDSPINNPQGPDSGPLRVLRGGAWNNQVEQLRASNRGGYPPDARRNDFGFRCARDAEEK